MSRTLHFAIPGDIEARTGGYGYDRRIMAELRGLGWQVEHVALPELVGAGAAAFAEAAARLARLPNGALVLVDGLAFAVMPEIAAREAGRLRLVALVHHPLALETGLSAEEAARLRELEIRALRFARAVVVTSPTTGRTLADEFCVAQGAITVVLPGTDRGAPRERRDGPPIILSVGSLIPRKAHDVLLQALAAVADLDWRCRIAGGDSMDPAWAASLRSLAAELGLESRVAFLGAVSDPAPLYAEADIFALPSRFEGYGMVFAEAMANGLPILAARAGAVPEVVPPEAGILVPPDDAPALAAALRRLIAEPDRRAELAAGAARAGEALPGWRDSARLLARVLEGAAA